MSESSEGADFTRVLCSVDGSSASDEAVRQAAALAAPEGSFIAVSVAAWGEVTLTAALSRERAQAALARAACTATELGRDVDTRLLEASEPSEALLAELRPGDLIVVGSHGHSRAAGMALGSVASSLVHRSPVPVLVARRPPAGKSFPEDIVVCSDGSDASRLAARLAGLIARRHDSRVLLLHVGDGAAAGPRDQLAPEATELYEMTGVEPVVLTQRGRAHEQIVELARREGASLVVLGSRGLGGARALGSVSERVAHGAEQSVLVARSAGLRATA